MTIKTDIPWRVLYTRYRYEKKVAMQLEEDNFIVYLPLKKELKQWTDRKKWIESPLFSNYLFIKADENSIREIPRNTIGVIKPIYIGGKLAEVKDFEIEKIRLISYSNIKTEVEFDTIQEGAPIKINSGPLKGLDGYLIKRKGKNKLSVKIESINATMYVEVNMRNVIKL